MTQRGGKREGAGRKKAMSTIEKEKMREYLIERVRAEMGPIVDAQIALALGVKVAGSDDVYVKAPDLNAARYLLDQTIGKARESVDLNHTGGVTMTLLERARYVQERIKTKKCLT